MSSKLGSWMRSRENSFLKPPRFRWFSRCPLRRKKTFLRTRAPAQSDLWLFFDSRGTLVGRDRHLVHALRCREIQPFPCLARILRHAPALGIHLSQSILALGVSELGGSTVTSGGGGEIPVHRNAVLQHESAHDIRFCAPQT